MVVTPIVTELGEKRGFLGILQIMGKMSGN